MSNADVQSRINQVRHNLNVVEQQNQQIRNELNMIATSARNGSLTLNATCVNTNTTLHNSINTIEYSHNQLKRTFNVQLQIKEMYFIFKDVETANKRIRFLTNKLYFDYKNQATLRKIVRGFFDNLDLNMVSDRVIHKSIEREFLQAPNYWLGYVLLAIMHWKSDDKDQAEKSVNFAVEKDPKSTAIFFMLFNLKIDRIEAAIKWFDFYRTLDKTGSDNNTFLMFISTVKSRINELDENDKVSDEFIKYIKEQIGFDQEDVDANYLSSIAYNYFDHLDANESIKQQNFRQYVAEAGTLSLVLSKAKNNQNILNYIEDLNKVHAHERNLFLNKYVDELLAVPSEEEREIIEEIKYNEEIIASMEPLKKMDSDTIFKSDDFRKMAKENHQAKVNHDHGKLNLVNEIVDWVYVNKNNSINSLTQWNLFSLCKDYTLNGYNSYLADYRSLMPKQFNLNLGEYHSTTKFDNLEEELNKKDKYCQEKLSRLLAQIKNTSAILQFVFGGLLIVLGIVLAFVLTWALALVAIPGLILIGTGLIKLLVSNPKRRRMIKESVKNESDKLTKILTNLFKEHKEIMAEYIEADDIHKYIQEMLNNI